MINSALTLFVSLVVVVEGPAPQEEIEYQEQTFLHWWGNNLERRFDELPTEGSVPDFRRPYSGHDYPDRAGGVDARQGRSLSPLGKYDTAFNDGRGLAVAHERNDVIARGASGGLFARRRQQRLEQLGRPIGLFEAGRARRTVGWYGHCNGWTAASIRHAEPQKSVRRNGVLFEPSDIKGLLAEIYMYSDTEFLGGTTASVNPGTLHFSLANWLGRGSHPVAMDTEIGKPVINYPIYAYKSTATRESPSQVEVKTTATYAMNSGRELNQSPRINQTMYFHYLLDLDDEGKIVGGRYFNDSHQVDMLWTPLKPVPSGQAGNERGNPHIDVKQVLSIWRDSVPQDLRDKWQNIDPEDDSEKDDSEKDDSEKDDTEKDASKMDRSHI